MATATVAVGTMKVAQISKPGAGFQVVERDIPKPGDENTAPGFPGDYDKRLVQRENEVKCRRVFRSLPVSPLLNGTQGR